MCWAILYLPHLRTNPKWYGDETLIHHTATNLVKGIPSNYALWNTFWHPHYPYQPLYTLLAGVFSSLANGDILGSRFFNVLLGLLCALALFVLGKDIFGARAALFASLMFLTYDQTIIHFRMSYAHNGAALGNLLLVLYLCRDRPSRANDLKAGLGLALSAGSHPLFIHPALAAFFVKIKNPKTWLILFAPTVCYLGLSMGLLYFRFGNWLIEDINHLRSTFTDRGGQDAPGLIGVFRNLTIFVFQDWYHLLCILGLLLCLNRKKWVLGFVGLWITLMLVKNRGNLTVFYYQAVVVLPILCLGWARFYELSSSCLQNFFRAGWLAWVFWFAPLSLFLAHVPGAWEDNLKPRNQYWVTQNILEVESCARWLNERIGADDLIAANPNIAWLLKAQTAPYLQIVTWYGFPTQGYENGNERERFRYDSSLERAKYAVVGDIDQRWTFGEPNVNKVTEKLQKQSWPVVWRGNFYLILANPAPRM